MDDIDNLKDWVDTFESKKHQLLTNDEQAGIKPYLSFFNKNYTMQNPPILQWEDLRVLYFKELDELLSKNPNCPPCTQGSLIRKYSRVILDYLAKNI